MEHVELLRMLAEMRHARNCGRAGPDNAHTFVRERVQAAGVVVIPAARVEGMAFELVDPRGWPGAWAGSEDYST
jgi:hypothetical protein